MAPEHFMYLGLKIWKLLDNVMVDCYLANCLICNNCSALHLQAGIEYSKCEGFGLIKTLLQGLLCASRQVWGALILSGKTAVTGFTGFEREPNKDVRENVSVSQRLLTGENTGRFLLLKSNWF